MSFQEMNFEPIKSIIVESESNSSLVTLFSIDSRSNSSDYSEQNFKSSKSEGNLKSLCFDEKNLPMVRSNGSLVSIDSCSKSYDSLIELQQEYIEEDQRVNLIKDNFISPKKPRRLRDSKIELSKSPQIKDVMKYLTNIRISPYNSSDLIEDKK